MKGNLNTPNWSQRSRPTAWSENEDSWEWKPVFPACMCNSVIIMAQGKIQFIMQQSIIHIAGSHIKCKTQSTLSFKWWVFACLGFGEISSHCITQPCLKFAASQPSLQSVGATGMHAQLIGVLKSRKLCIIYEGRQWGQLSWKVAAFCYFLADVSLWKSSKTEGLALKRVQDKTQKWLRKR